MIMMILLSGNTRAFSLSQRGAPTHPALLVASCAQEYIAYVFVRMGGPERIVGRTPGEPHLEDSVKHDAAVKTTRIKARAQGEKGGQEEEL